MKKLLLVLGMFASSCLLSSVQATTIGDLANQEDFETSYGNVVIVDYGECGDDGDPVYWAVNATKDTMYITGDGWMEDYYIFDCWINTEPYRCLTKVPDFMNASKNYSSTITTVIVDKYVGLLGCRAWKGMKNLKNFIVDPNNQWLKSKDGVVYSFNSTQNNICAYPTGREGAFTIPDDVTGLNEGAFFYCDKLTSLTFPESFSGRVEQDCFMGCSELSNIVWPKGEITLGIWAFQDCDKLISVNMGLTYINHGTAFAGCSNLKEINITDSTNIKNCSIDGVLFTKLLGSFRLYEYPVGSPRTEYTIPDGCTGIAQSAFFKAKKLEAITFPSSMQSISSRAFFGCDNIKRITCLGEKPAAISLVGSDTDDDNPFATLDKENCVVYVPVGCVDAYKAAKYWKDFKYIQEIEPTGINDVNVASASKARKVVKDGQIIIENNGKQYNVAGMEIK